MQKNVQISLRMPAHYLLDSASSIIPALEAWQDFLDGIAQQLAQHQHNKADVERVGRANLVKQMFRLSPKYIWRSLPLWDAAMSAIGSWRGDVGHQRPMAILFESPLTMIEGLAAHRIAQMSVLISFSRADAPLALQVDWPESVETVWFGSGVTPDGDWDNFAFPLPLHLAGNVEVWSSGTWLTALMDFIHSPIIAASTLRELPTYRAERRRLAGVVIPEDVRLVMLRPHKSQADGGDGTPVDWSCQWIVTGHWRQQWCPKAQQHKSLWILPYVKGPADKPLRAPRQRIYTVVR